MSNVPMCGKLKRWRERKNTKLEKEQLFLQCCRYFEKKVYVETAGGDKVQLWINWQEEQLVIWSHVFTSTFLHLQHNKSLDMACIPINFA